MVYSGYYDGFVCYGTDPEDYKVKAMDQKTFLERCEIDYDYSVAQISTDCEKFQFFTIRDAKRWLTGLSTTKTNMLLKHALKRGFDAETTEQVISWCFFNLAILDYCRKIVQLDRRSKILMTKHEREIQLAARLAKMNRQSLAEQEGGEFNFNTYDWHSCHNLDKAVRVRNSISVTDAEKYGFKQVFEGGILYINSKKQILFRQGDFLYCMHDAETIKEINDNE